MTPDKRTAPRTFVLSLLMVAIGVALIVQALGAARAADFARGCCWACCSSPPGSARTYLEIKRGRGTMSVGRRDPRRSQRGRRGPARARRAGRPGCGGARGALARDREAQHRLADPVHDRLHVAGERALLLAGGDRGPRARAHAARVPDRGAAVHAHRDDLRGGRLAAPGPRRARRCSPATPSTSS